MPIALITGASRGLGRVLAASLAADGWRLVIDGRDRDDLQAAAGPGRGEPPGGGLQVVAVPAVDAHRRELVAAAGDRLDLLVLNASTLGPAPLPALASYDVDALRRVFEVNTIAPLAMVQLALPALRAATGRILAVSSDAAVEGYPGWGGYGASKAALDQLVRVLAAEEPGLRIYAVDPGDMRTAMHQAAYPGQDISDRPEPAAVVPALRRLVDGEQPSGRYQAARLSEVPVT